ncbi:MAG: hypothetical protein BWY83_03379 [bacterium ADurb.Bin478]|nr:MAG: hypothetical protein BWY83_03379 [bacterium ADurb.Bin478]
MAVTDEEPSAVEEPEAYQADQVAGASSFSDEPMNDKESQHDED